MLFLLHKYIYDISHGFIKFKEYRTKERSVEFVFTFHLDRNRTRFIKYKEYRTKKRSVEFVFTFHLDRNRTIDLSRQ